MFVSFSDHNLVTSKICRRPYENRQSQKQRYSVKRADWNGLRNLLLHTLWHLRRGNKQLLAPVERSFSSGCG